MRTLPSPVDGQLVNRTCVRVLFGDTDAAGIVYHANYLRWCEHGRGEFLREGGCSLKGLIEDGVMTPIVEAHLRFVTPARYDDILEVQTWVEKMRSASITFAHLMSVGDRRVALARVEVACLDSDGRPARMPGSLEAFRPPPSGG